MNSTQEQEMLGQTSNYVYENLGTSNNPTELMQMIPKTLMKDAFMNMYSRGHFELNGAQNLKLLLDNDDISGLLAHKTELIEWALVMMTNKRMMVDVFGLDAVNDVRVAKGLSKLKMGAISPKELYPIDADTPKPVGFPVGYQSINSRIEAFSESLSMQDLKAIGNENIKDAFMQLYQAGHVDAAKMILSNRCEMGMTDSSVEELIEWAVVMCSDDVEKHISVFGADAINLTFEHNPQLITNMLENYPGGNSIELLKQPGIKIDLSQQSSTSKRSAFDLVIEAANMENKMAKFEVAPDKKVSVSDSSMFNNSAPASPISPANPAKNGFN